METNPTLVQLIGLDETVVIIGINIQFSNCSGQMNFCLPGSMLSAIFARIAAANQAGKRGPGRTIQRRSLIFSGIPSWRYLRSLAAQN